MNDLVKFNFNGNDMTTINDGKGELWFVAAEVCAILWIGNARQAVTVLDDDEKNTVRISDGIPGNPNKTVNNESGLYALAVRSTKPEAKAFRKWVPSEVLPKIRKTGGYSVDPITVLNDPVTMRCSCQGAGGIGPPRSPGGACCKIETDGTRCGGNLIQSECSSNARAMLKQSMSTLRAMPRLLLRKRLGPAPQCP